MEAKGLKHIQTSCLYLVVLSMQAHQLRKFKTEVKIQN